MRMPTVVLHGQSEGQLRIEKGTSVAFVDMVHSIATPGTNEGDAFWNDFEETGPGLLAWVQRGAGHVSFLSSVLTGALHPLVLTPTIYYTTILELGGITGWVDIGGGPQQWYACHRCGARCQSVVADPERGCVMCEEIPDDEYPYFECDCVQGGGPSPFSTCPRHAVMWERMPVGAYELSLPVNRLTNWVDTVDKGKKRRNPYKEKHDKASHPSSSKSEHIRELMNVAPESDPEYIE